MNDHPVMTEREKPTGAELFNLLSEVNGLHLEVADSRKCHIAIDLARRLADALRAPLAVDAEVERLRAAVGVALGYMRNAAIDLDTGAPKRTALATINGGIKAVEAALAATPAEQ